MGSVAYFSEREIGSTPPSVEIIDKSVWKGLLSLVGRLIDKAALAESFPECCTDNHLPYATDREAFWQAVQLEHPHISAPLSPEPHSPMQNSDAVPETIWILDFLEFVHDHVAKPVQDSCHQFFQHYHLTFDQESGQKGFRTDINRVFERNSLAYRLDEDGRFQRVLPSEIASLVGLNQFDTGDNALDELLTSARRKFLEPDPRLRVEAIEKLWDAWERLKSLEDDDKKRSVERLLDNTSDQPEFRSVLEREAHTLTDIGNTFHIRHFEQDRHELPGPAEVDYLFVRLFALVRLILDRTDRLA